MSKGYRRDLNNLFGDAQSSGAEFRARITAFTFREHRAGQLPGAFDVVLHYEMLPSGKFAGRVGYIATAEELSPICSTLRGMGWRECDVIEDDDGRDRICVTVEDPRVARGRCANCGKDDVR